MNNKPVGTQDFSYHPHVAYDNVKNIYFTTFNVLRPKDLIDSKIQLSYPEGSSSFVQDVNEFIKNNLPQIAAKVTPPPFFFRVFQTKPQSINKPTTK